MQIHVDCPYCHHKTVDDCPEFPDFIPKEHIKTAIMCGICLKIMMWTEAGCRPITCDEYQRLPFPIKQDFVQYARAVTVRN